jgi:hypothetical protein
MAVPARSLVTGLHTHVRPCRVRADESIFRRGQQLRYLRVYPVEIDCGYAYCWTSGLIKNGFILKGTMWAEPEPVYE